MLNGKKNKTHGNRYCFFLKRKKMEKVQMEMIAGNLVFETVDDFSRTK